MKRNGIRITVLLLPLLLAAGLLAAELGRAGNLLFIGGTAVEVVSPVDAVTDLQWVLGPSVTTSVQGAQVTFDGPLEDGSLVCVQVTGGGVPLANGCSFDVDTSPVLVSFGTGVPGGGLAGPAPLAADIYGVNVSVVGPPALDLTGSGDFPLEIVDVRWILWGDDTSKVAQVDVLFAPFEEETDNGFEVYVALQDKDGLFLAQDVLTWHPDPDYPTTLPWPLPVPPGVSAEAITRFAIGFKPNDPWDAMRDVPDNVGLGAGMTTDGTHIYLQIGSRNRLYRFDPGTGQWTPRTGPNSLARAPSSPDQGAALVFAEHGGKGYLYALRGGNKTDFWRYDIALNKWESMADAPGGVRWGGALTWDGRNTIYAFRGESPDFWKYSIASNQWSTLLPAPGIVSAGGALVYVQGSVYALQGGPVQGEGSVGFWRFAVNEYGSGTWSTTPPASFPAPAGRGAALASDGDDIIYALRGNDTKEIWRYVISEDNGLGGAQSWVIGPDIPLDMREGGTLVFLGGDVYATQGRQQSDFVRISPLPFTVYEPKE